jgi:hypothetical protein
MVAEVLDLNDTIKLLAGDRPERFAHEAAIRLFQFKVWMYTADVAEFESSRIAGLVAAARFLRDLSPKHHVFANLTRREAYGSGQLVKLLRDPDFGSLFDSIIAEYGGWSALAEVMNGPRFDEQISYARAGAKIVAEMVSYQFRYRDHGGMDSQLANNSHARFFVYKKTPRVPGKSSKQQWSRFKASSIFLYVNETHDFKFFPPTFATDNFAGSLTRAAANRPLIKKFLGFCSYVASRLIKDHQVFEDQSDMLVRIKERRPTTAALSAQELNLMESYDSEYQKMRDS